MVFNLDASQYRAKTTKLPRLAYMLDFIVMQMSRVDCEKGYSVLAISKHESSWENSRQLCEPETHAFMKYFSKVLVNLKRHNRVFILSSNHTNERSISALFHKTCLESREV